MSSLPRLVIASGNSHKVSEIAGMLALVGVEVIPQPKGLEVEETGHTYVENARLKAETVARHCGAWALADDSGLEVEALGGRPGL
jgi:non-canonical purine NTP pyrophosphatase (RdgB/HAM1 family)